MSVRAFAVRLGGERDGTARRKERTMSVLVFSTMFVTLIMNALVAPGAARHDHKEAQMARYMLVLHESPSDYAGMSVEDMNGIVREYMAWRESLERDGHFAGGEKLADEGGRTLSMRDGQVRVTDGPYAEAKEVMGGYFIVSAASYDEAVEIARTCPHLKYGGRIELRLVDEIGEAAAGH
jgi:hypothetical protein